MPAADDTVAALDEKDAREPSTTDHGGAPLMKASNADDTRSTMPPSSASSEVEDAGALAAVEAAAASWFDRKVFAEPGFDASAYVDKMSPYVSMDTLKGELESYLGELQAQLVDLVNRDYEKFVSLSTDLVDVESTIEDWEAPIEAFKAEVTNTRSAVVEVLEQLNDALRRQQENAEKKATLELMMDTNNVVSKVERLLEELGETDAHAAAAAAAAKTATADGDAAIDKALRGEEDVDDEEGIVAQEDEEGLDMLKPRLAGGAAPSALALAAEDSGGGGGVGRKGKAKGDDADNNHARLLERVSSEVNRLRFLAGKGARLKFIQTLQPRIETAEAELARAVKAALAKAIEARSKPALGHCLRAHLAVGRVREAEDVIRSRLVAPAVKKVLDAAPPPAALGSREDLAPLLTACADAALDACAVELELTRDVESGLAAQYNLLANAVLAEVDAQLSAARPAAYSPGVPDAFKRNHAAALALVDALEAKIPSRVSLSLFRGSPALAAYVKRWNLSVYFTLRFQEIVNALESDMGDGRGLVTAPADAISGNVKGGRGGGGPTFLLASTAATWAALRKCWAEDIFAAPIADRFVRLSAQILSRYGGWLGAGVDALGSGRVRRSEVGSAAEAGTNNDGANNSPPPLTGPGTKGNTGEEGANKGGDASGSGARRAKESDGAAASWGATAGLDELMMVRADVELLVGRVSSELLTDVTAALTAAAGPAAAECASEVIGIGVDRLRGEAVVKLNDALVGAVVERCLEALKQLKGITATFRMTNKPLPTRHSHFVPGILAPLKTVVEAESAKAMSGESRREIVLAVSDGVSTRYGEMAAELVTTVKKTEASLNRLKDRKAVKAGAAGGKDSKDGKDGAKVSDTDKICKQLHLDVVEYGAQLVSLGVDPKSRETFKALWATAAPENEPMPDS